MNTQTTFTTESQYVFPRIAKVHSRLSRNHSGLLASLGIAALLLVSAPAFAIAPPVLGVAQSFAIVGGMNPGVTFAPPMNFVNGDIGIEPTALLGITGLANATVTAPFAIYAPPASNPVRAAITTLSLDPIMAPAGGVAITANMSTGGPTANGHYTPGKYALAGGVAIIPTSITLDGPGIYVFSLNSALTTSVGSTVILNGADPCSVFWLVPTLATLNGVNFPGTIVAGTGVHMGVGAVLTGRALAAAAGDVTLAGSNSVGGCSAAVSAPGGLSLGKAFSPTTIAAGGVSTLTITLSNGNATATTLISPLTDTLPAGMVIAPTPNASTTCNIGVVGLGGGVVSATPGGSTVTLSTESTIPGGPGSCTVTVNVTAAGLCSFPNTLSAGALVTNLGNNPGAVSATLTIPSICGVVGGGGAVPTLSEWAMIMLAALLAIAGFAAMRRQAR
jgi:uncharacterized repeat protein (TIGR01451 family)